jgi:hypothetical protein
MPAGIQLWDASGNLQTSSVTNSLLSEGSPFYFIAASTNESNRYPFVSFSGTTMSWTKSTATDFAGAIFYGVY